MLGVKRGSASLPITALQPGAPRRSTDRAYLASAFLADVLGIGLAAALTLTMRPTFDPRGVEALTLLCAVIWLGLSVHAGLYRQKVVMNALLDVPAVVTTTMQGGALALAVMALRGVADERFVSLGMLVLTGVPCRIVARSTVQTALNWRRPGIKSRMLIVGAGAVAQRLAATLIKYKDLGIAVVGFVDDHDYASGTRRALHLPVFRGDDLDSVIDRYCVDHVVFAFSRLPDSERLHLLRVCREKPHVQVSMVPRLFEAIPANTRLLDIRGIPLVHFETGAHLLELAGKRIFDIVAAGVGLALTLPLMVLAASAIRLEGSGPVLFRQCRVGQDGRHFTMYKLRSMREAHSAEDPASEARLTRVGTVIRMLGIDELPQLWNVVRGDMSLVGPRPEQVHYVELFNERIPRYMERHRMRGGITGLSQVSRLRGDTSIVERTQLDNFYVDNWSLWLDIKILISTASRLVPASQGIGGDAMLRDIVDDVIRFGSYREDRAPEESRDIAGAAEPPEALVGVGAWDLGGRNSA